MITSDKKDAIDLISIIVPIYNVKDYLYQCIDSILAQTHTNLEVILVDDGSSDGSGDICDDYEKRDSRIRVIHKLNAGVSAARNTALDIITGEYVGFVDGDDWLEPEMYQRLYQGIKENKAQMSSCDISARIDGKDIRINSKQLRENCVEGDNVYTEFIGQPWALWNKLFAIDTVRDIRMSTTIAYGEDLLYIVEALTKVSRTVTSEYVGYNYRLDRDGNISSAIIQKSHMTSLDAGMKIYEILKEKGERAQQLSAVCVNGIIRNLCTRVCQAKGIPYEARRDFNKKLKKYIRFFYKKNSAYTNNIGKIGQKIFLVSPWLYGKLRKIKS